MKIRAWGANVMAEHLRLSISPPRQSTFCPFHENTDTPAFSVNFATAQWYCHSEKRGGGIIAFLIAWAKAKDGKDLTRAEAKRLLSRSFKVPSAKELLLQDAADQVRLFVKFVGPDYADHARLYDRYARIAHMFPDEMTWNAQAERIIEHSFLSWAAEVCRVSLVNPHEPHPQLPYVYAAAKRRGEWSYKIAVECREREAHWDSMIERKHELLESVNWFTEEWFTPGKVTEECRESPSPPMSTPMPRQRTAVTTLPIPETCPREIPSRKRTAVRQRTAVR